MPTARSAFISRCLDMMNMHLVDNFPNLNFTMRNTRSKSYRKCPVIHIVHPVCRTFPRLFAKIEHSLDTTRHYVEYALL